MKRLNTMRERARALAQECVLFGKMRGSQWDGLTELFVAFAENEIRLLGVDGGPREMPMPDMPATPKDKPDTLARASGESSAMAPEEKPLVREFTIRICQQCYTLDGEMCHNAECVFCRRTMAEVSAFLDALLLRPIIDGERLDLHPLEDH